MPTPSRLFRRISRTSARLAPLSLVLALASAFAQTTTPAVPPVEQRSTLQDQQSVAVTIYNEDLALVKDTRRLTLVPGLQRIALRDVSARIRPETAQLRSLTHPGSFDLLEQNFDFDLLTPAKLLEKYVGREVRVLRTHPTTGAETSEAAQVLAAGNGVVLRMGDRIETGVPGRIVFDSVPPNLRDRPTLVTELQSRRAGAQEVELSYLTGGLSWRADYVAELDADDRTLSLNGWITLNNQSGTAYTNALLQLVAGNVNRVRDEIRQPQVQRAVMPMAAPAPAPMAQEALFEYHLYTLQRPTTVADNQTKQVALLGATAVPVTKELLVRGSDYYYRSSAGDLGQKLKAAVFVEFANREDAQLGQPLPKGVVRVYKRDSAGRAQFVGEDRIDHTPKNETVRLRLGEAFDVTASKKQTDFRRRETTNQASYVAESAYEIVLRNATDPQPTASTRPSAIDSPQGAQVHLGTGAQVLNFCANNYLGLANDPRLIKAAQDGLDEDGFGMASVRFICGTQSVHKQLEASIRSFLGTEDTILYVLLRRQRRPVRDPAHRRGRGHLRRAQPRLHHRRRAPVQGQALSLPQQRHGRPRSAAAGRRRRRRALQADRHRRRVLDGRHHRRPAVGLRRWPTNTARW
jgi:hypothetical protein